MAEETDTPATHQHTHGLYVVDHNGSLCQADVLRNVKTLPHLQEIPADIEEVVFLGEAGPNHQLDNDSILSPLQYLVEVYRQANLADKDRQTILTYNDQLVSLQLCMAQYNKQKFDDFDVDASEVLQLSHQLYSHKLNPSSSALITTTQSTFDAVQTLYSEFCESCNAVDLLDVFHKVKAWFADDGQVDVRKKCLYVVLQWPRDELEIEILKLLSPGGSYCHVTIESMDGNVDMSSKEESVETLLSKTIKTVASPSTPTSPSASEMLARQLFISYLTLLVNSCEEISLARCLSLTTDDFNHDGFTALKNQAKAKNMPMFQTAVSYVIQIRLGGKSYAPNPDSPLAPHVKGLSDFVTAMQKLQTIVEEVSDTRTAVMKVISSIRSSLNKCKVSTLRKSSIDSVAEQLNQEMEALMGTWKGSLMESPPRKIEGQGRIIYGLKTIRILQAVLDREAGRTLTNKPIQVLTDGFTQASQKTPMRIPSLLSQFRSPEVVDPSSPEYQTLRSRLFSPKEKTPVGPTKWQSDLTWAGAAVGNNTEDMDIFISPAQRKPPKKGNGLWAVSPGGRRSQSRLVSPNSTDVGNGNVGTSAHQLAVRSQSILDCSDTPKKGKTATRKLPKDSALDKENLQNEDEVPKMGGNSKKRKPKRTLGDDSSCSSQITKKAKKATKVSKKKVVPLGKGQKTLNQFFRV